MPDQAFTITRRNNATEKEGIQYMESLNQGFFFVNKDERQRILELLEQPKNYSRSFDMVHVPRLSGTSLSLESIETHIEEATLIELKCTRAFLPNNPKGFFFGATQNEFDFGDIAVERSASAPALPRLRRARPGCAAERRVPPLPGR